MHTSIATLKEPEFLNLKPCDINPLMSECVIKVLYEGENRNHSFLSKATIAEMAKTLRGCPIVGWYKESKEDFADHGQVVTFDDEGVHVDIKTVPYGFVAPDAQVWFKEFQETDAEGNSVLRNYLMTTGYLWTGQFEECKVVTQDPDGRPHSMELDEERTEGYWTNQINSNYEIFIITDSVFSKLCILGSDVEPCFEGSDIKSFYSLKDADNKFSRTLFSMMEDLKKTLEGGATMPTENVENVQMTAEEPATEFEVGGETPEVTVENTEPATGPEAAPAATEYENLDNNQQEEPAENDIIVEGENPSVSTETEFSKNEEKTVSYAEYTALVEERDALQARVDALSAECAKYQEAEKDEVIAQFSMLSDEDKKNVIANKANLTALEIKSQLALIGFEKGVNFSKATEEDSKESEEAAPVTYTVQESNEGLSAIVRAIQEANKEN